GPAVADVEQDAAFPRFEQVGQQTPILIEHRDGDVERVRVDIPGPQSLQDEFLKRALRTEFAEIDHHGNVGQSSSFDAALYGSPVRPAIVRDFDADDRVAVVDCDVCGPL